jgi:hypothetical protein
MAAPLSAAAGCVAAAPRAPRAAAKRAQHARRRAAQPARRLRVVATGVRPGGGGGGGGLILPGSEGFPEGYAGAGAGGPGGRPGGGPGGRPGGFGPVTSAPREGPLYQPFRPPAAYKETAVLPQQELMTRLTGARRASSA